MRLLTPLALALSMAGLLAGCASTGIDSDDPHAPMHEGRSPAQMSGATSSAEMDAAPISSLSQFSTQRIPIDARVPSTFVVRAICMLGTDPHR